MVGGEKVGKEKRSGRAPVGGASPSSQVPLAPKDHITSYFHLSTGQIVLSSKAWV